MLCWDFARSPFFSCLLKAVHRLYNVVTSVMDVAGVLSSATPLLLVEQLLSKGNHTSSFHL